MILRSIFALGLISVGMTQLSHFDAASVLPTMAIQQPADGTWQKTALSRLNDMKGEFQATQNNVMMANGKPDLNRIAGVVRTSVEVSVR